MSTLLMNREELFSPFRERFDKLFDSFFGSDSLHAVKSNARSSGYPKVDVVLNGDQYRVQAALPGVRLDDLKVEILPYKLEDGDHKLLKITGKMREQYQTPADSVYHIRELRRSYFERTIPIPDSLVGDPDAVLSDGLLTLCWKTIQREASPQPKLIPVKEQA